MIVHSRSRHNLRAALQRDPLELRGEPCRLDDRACTPYRRRPHASARRRCCPRRIPSRGETRGAQAAHSPLLSRRRPSDGSEPPQERMALHRRARSRSSTRSPSPRRHALERQMRRLAAPYRRARVAPVAEPAAAAPSASVACSLAPPARHSGRATRAQSRRRPAREPRPQARPESE